MTTRFLPAMDSGRLTGFFSYRLFLSSQFPAGDYRVIYRYRIGGHTYIGHDAFSVTPGGHADGAVLSLGQYVRPGARWVVQQLEAGAVVAGKNPYL